MKLQLTSKLQFLITERWRYKVLHGGRAGGKSHAVARALIYLVARRRLRVLCTREVQKSLRESVHQLLSDTINAVGAGAEFQVLESEIRHRDGGVFLFAGLSTQTADSLKSYEGVDIVWVEEAHSVTARSWRILGPTIRKPGSEIWVTFNPSLAGDATYQRFAAGQPPPRSKVAQINYYDNPWRSQETEDERLNDLRTLTPELYANIWLGEPLETVEGAIYAAEMKHLRKMERIGDVPVSPSRPVNTFWDLGTSTGNATCVWLHQRVGLADRFPKAIGGTGGGMEHWWRQLEAWRLANGVKWGVHHLPHDGKQTLQARQLTNRQKILQELVNESPGAASPVVSVQRVDDLTVAIDLTRRRILDGYFDASGCAGGLAALKAYRYEWIESEKRYSRTPYHGPESNWADALRTWATGYKPEGPGPGSRPPEQSRAYPAGMY